MTNDDVIYRSRLRLFGLAREMGSVRAACRLLGVHHSTYYRWRRQMVTYGPESLRPRERRPVRMANSISPMVEQRVVALSLGHPGWGPNRLSFELGRQKWGGIRISSNGVWRVLRRHGLNTRAQRLGLIAGHASPPELVRPQAQPERHIQASHPGHRVQMDCLCIGRLSGTQGVVWQYTAIDVATSFTWAELHATPKNPAPRWTSQLARRVAQDLAQRGWNLEAVMTDNGSEFRSQVFNSTLTQLKAIHIYIRPGRPQSNGCVERVQQTILHECWKPTFARYLVPKSTGLQRDLARYLHLYNTDRAHTGRRNHGLTPDQAFVSPKLWA